VEGDDRRDDVDVEKKDEKLPVVVRGRPRIFSSSSSSSSSAS
jgi:hypothetical protein